MALPPTVAMCTTVICVALGIGPTTAAATTRRIPLVYDAQLAAADFPSPAVRMRVGDTTAWFLVDTGAGVHLLASWFAERAGLRIDETLASQATAVDSTGRRLGVRGVRDVEGVLDDGGPLRLPLAMFTDFPKEFEEAGVGGALSPQLLATAGEAATLDLRVPDLRLEPFSNAIQRLAARAVQGTGATVCGSVSGTVPNLLFSVPVTVRGRKGSALIDTGARVTKIAPASPLLTGVRFAPGGQTTGVAGVGQAFSVARGLPIEFAGHAVTVDARVGERGREACGPDGLLGLDALRACAVVMGSDRLAVSCDP